MLNTFPIGDLLRSVATFEHRSC